MKKQSKSKSKKNNLFDKMLSSYYNSLEKASETSRKNDELLMGTNKQFENSIIEEKIDSVSNLDQTNNIPKSEVSNLEEDKFLSASLLDRYIHNSLNNSKVVTKPQNLEESLREHSILINKPKVNENKNVRKQNDRNYASHNPITNSIFGSRDKINTLNPYDTAKTTYDNTDRTSGYQTSLKNELNHSLYNINEEQSICVTEAENQRITQNKSTVSLVQELGKFKELKLVFKMLKGARGYLGGWNYTFFNNDGQAIAVWLRDNKFCLTDIETKSEIKSVENVHKSIISIFKSSPKGNFFISVDITNFLLVWSCSELKIDYAFKCSSKNREVTGLSWSNDEKFIAIGSRNCISVWKLSEEKKVRVFNNCHDGDVRNLVFSSNGNYLISCCSNFDTNIKIWDLEKKAINEVIKIQPLIQNDNTNVTKSSFKTIDFIKLDPTDENLLVVSAKANYMYSFDSNSIIEGFNYKTHIRSAEFTKCGNYICVGVDCSIEVIEKKTGVQLKRKGLCHSGEIENLNFDIPGELQTSCCKGKVFIVHKYNSSMEPQTSLNFPVNSINIEEKTLPKRNEIHDMPIIDTFIAKSTEWRRSNNHIYFKNNSECIIVWVKDNRFLLQDMTNKSLIDSFDSQHDSNIVSFISSPNSEYFITTDEGNNMILWDSETLHIIQRYDWHNDKQAPKDKSKLFKKKQGPKYSPKKKGKTDLENVQRNLFCAAWSPDNQFFAVGGLNNIRIFDFSGDLEWQLFGEESNLEKSGTPTNVCFSPSGKMLAVSYKNSIQIWSIKDKKLIWENNGPHTYKDLKGKERLDTVNEISFSNEDKYLFSSADNSDKQWCLKENNNLIEFSEIKAFTSNNNLSCFDFSPDNKYLVIGTDEGGLLVYDINLMQKVLYNDMEDSAALQQLKFNAEGTYLATIDFNKTARLHKLEFMTEEMMRKNQYDPQNLDEQDFQIMPRKMKDEWDESEQQENEPSEDDFALLESPEVHRIEDQSALKQVYKNQDISKRANNFIKSLSFRADGQYLLVNCFNDEMKIMNTTTKQIKASIDDHHKSNILIAKFSPNNKFFFSAGEDNRVIIWDSETFKRLHVFNLSRSDLNASPTRNKSTDRVDETVQNIFDAVWLPEGESILVAGMYHLYELNIRNKEEDLLIENVFSNNGIRTELRCLDVNPDGMKIVVASNFDFKTVSLETGHDIFYVTRPHTYFNIKNQKSVDDIQSVSWSKCGNFLLTCSENNNIFWQAEKGTRVYAISGNYKINTISYNFDGSLLVAGCKDRTIRVFDMKNLRFQIEIADAHKYQILSISVAPESNYIASGDVNGTVKFFNQVGQTDEIVPKDEIKKKIHIEDVSESEKNSYISELDKSDHNKQMVTGDLLNVFGDETNKEIPSTRIIPSGFNTPDKDSFHESKLLNENLQDGTINFSDLPNEPTANLLQSYSNTRPHTVEPSKTHSVSNLKQIDESKNDIKELPYEENHMVESKDNLHRSNRKSKTTNSSSVVNLNNYTSDNNTNLKSQVTLGAPKTSRTNTENDQLNKPAEKGLKRTDSHNSWDSKSGPPNTIPAKDSIKKLEDIRASQCSFNNSNIDPSVSKQSTVNQNSVMNSNKNSMMNSNQSLPHNLTKPMDYPEKINTNADNNYENSENNSIDHNKKNQPGVAHSSEKALNELKSNSSIPKNNENTHYQKPPLSNKSLIKTEPQYDDQSPENPKKMTDSQEGLTTPDNRPNGGYHPEDSNVSEQESNLQSHMGSSLDYEGSESEEGAIDFARDIVQKDYNLVSDILVRHVFDTLSLNINAVPTKLFMKFSDPSKLLVNMDSEFQQFDLEKLKCLHANDSHTEPVIAVAYTGGNDQYIWSAGNVFFFNYQTMRITYAYGTLLT